MVGKKAGGTFASFRIFFLLVWSFFVRIFMLLELIKGAFSNIKDIWTKFKVCINLI